MTKCVEVVVVGVRVAQYKEPLRFPYTVVLQTSPRASRASLPFDDAANGPGPARLDSDSGKLTVTVYTRKKTLFSLTELDAARRHLFGLCEVPDLARRAAEARGFMWLRLHDEAETAIVGEVLMCVRFALGIEDHLATIRDRITPVLDAPSEVHKRTASLSVLLHNSVSRRPHSHDPGEVSPRRASVDIRRASVDMPRRASSEICRAHVRRPSADNSRSATRLSPPPPLPGPVTPSATASSGSASPDSYGYYSASGSSAASAPTPRDARPVSLPGPVAPLGSSGEGVAKVVLCRDPQPLEVPVPLLSADGPPDPVDFNERFQRLLCCLIELRDRQATEDEQLAVHQEIAMLSKDFLYCAQTYGRIIIAERYLDVSLKTIKPCNIGGIAGGEKYIICNVLFKFAVDDKGMFQSDESAAKCAGHELKSLIQLYNVQFSSRLDFYLPLLALVDYRGHRIIAETIIPINGRSTLAMGSADGGANVLQVPPHALGSVEKVASAFNLMPHRTRHGGDTVVHSCIDLEGHNGLDGRFYLLDFARVFPPEGPPAAGIKRLRPEFVMSYKRRLCSDAFSGFLNQEETEAINLEVQLATQHLKTVVIPAFATELVDMVYDGTVLTGSIRYDLKAPMHSRGINMRFLGDVLFHVREAKKVRRRYMLPFIDNACSLVLVEMAVRSLRSLLNVRLREMTRVLRFPVESQYTFIYLELLQALSSNAPHAGLTWTQVLEVMKEKFSFDAAKELCISSPARALDVISEMKLDGKERNFGKLLLLTKFLELTGCKLSKRFLLTLGDCPSEFDAAMAGLKEKDIKRVEERVKDLSIVDSAQGFVSKLSSTAQSSSSEKRLLYDAARKAFQKALS
eukprot:m51a1_g12149 hypothetical protein (856) ;mRNA; f:1295-4715